MSRAEHLGLSLFYGLLLTAATTLGGLYVEHPVLARVLLWQVVPLSMLHDALLGPGPVLSHDEQGQPVYEGTPVLFLVFALGVLLAVPIYWCLSYLLLRRLARREGGRLR